MDLHASLTLTSQNKLFANPRRIFLLQQIDATGSISQGAKLASISYKAAWDAVNEMNKAFNQKVVINHARAAFFSSLLFLGTKHRN